MRAEQPVGCDCVRSVVRTTGAMKALVLLHRWLGIGFCLLFAMWFASGIVMHFVPFPQLDGGGAFCRPVADRSVAGAARPGRSGGCRRRRRTAPGAAATTGRWTGLHHSRCLKICGRSCPRSVRRVGEIGAARSGDRAGSCAPARHRHFALRFWPAWRTTINGACRTALTDHRPLYRVALERFRRHRTLCSSTTGEIVLATTRDERVWNYAGSVAHWIYPTILRRTPGMGQDGMDIVADRVGHRDQRHRAGRDPVAGLGWARRDRRSSGWHAWHHVLGLFTATFVLTWIFSGWLSMDHGLLFSRGRLSRRKRRG